MGATREDVRGVILARATFLNLTGTVIGIMGALAFASLLESVLYEITRSHRHPAIRV
jgi:ABC-type lipoprotein release transport system permease subunit